MRKSLRGTLAVVVIAMLVMALASPAAAAFRTSDPGNEPDAVPLVFDVLVLRPMGLMLTVAGAMVYAFPVAPIMAVTRPTDIWKPFGTLVVTPGRFTFGDRIGRH